MTEKNIIVALDDPLDYQGVLEVLDPKKCIIKVGSVIFNYHGRKILDEVSGHGFEIFFDIADNYKVKKNCSVASAKTVNNNYCDISAPDGAQW